ncbi:hypothetical protein Tco_0875032 [Tanacetum coccineum]|uniref:Uncharacterized protein n=1 Tax=Tanacetum coccineum TaxID=301880 RepID=A0ABQ5BNB5_9ASTR
MHVNSKPKEHVHGFGYTLLFAKVVKGNEAQECHDTPVMVLEWGSLNYGGDSVLVECVKDFKNIHNWNAQFEIPDRVVWIDVEVILEGKVSVVHVKEVTGWDPDFREDDIAQSKDGSDNNSIGIHKWEEENNDNEVILISFQSIVNEYNIMENPPNHVENSPGQMENSPNHVENFNDHLKNSHEQLENSPDHVENSHVHGENSPVHLENSHDLCGDPFSLEKLILE